MRLKDIREGEVYAVVRYFDKRLHTAVEEEGRLEAREWETAYSTLFAGRVVETGVQVGNYSRPGVRVQRLDRQTLESLKDDAGEVVETEAFLAANVLMPWAEWDRRWHEHVEGAREAERERRERHEREQARRQEKAAREWMDRTFAQARRDIADVFAVLNGDGEEGEPSDDQVRALVERRHPEGNPFLNGSRDAH